MYQGALSKKKNISEENSRPCSKTKFHNLHGGSKFYDIRCHFSNKNVSGGIEQKERYFRGKQQALFQNKTRFTQGEEMSRYYI